MSRYPTIASLLRPDLVIAFRVACWLVSSHADDRRSGRTTVLAAAFLHELASGRSSHIWDHSVPPGNQKLRVMEDALRLMASRMGMGLDISMDKILRGMGPDELGVSVKNSVFLTDEFKTDFEVMKEAVRKVYRSGATEEDIITAIVQAVHEEAVVLVHDR